MIKPDNSYQEFSKYSRRRKHKRSFTARQILVPLVILLALGGTAWLLLGARKVNPPPPPPPKPYDPDNYNNNNNDVPPFIVESPIWDRIRIGNPTMGVVVGSNVNVRQNHSTTGQIVTKLSAGARTEVVERWEGSTGTLTGPWFRVRSDGKDGWIYGQYIQPLDGRSATLPEGYTAALLESFGGSRAELASQIGQPARQQTATTMTWDGLTVTLKGDEVTRLILAGAKHVLQNEVAVGITAEALYRRMGYPSEYRSGQVRYIENGDYGVSVVIQNGKVQRITVGNI